MTERALATIRTIDAIEPIPDADAIEAAKVGGWTVVVRKGEFAAGEQAVYFEIDSFLPMDRVQYNFLAPRGVRKMTLDDGSVVEGHVLRTAKLRGVYSQGLLLPIDDFHDLTITVVDGVEYVNHDDGEDVSEVCGVHKWDPPIPVELSGAVAGPFPTHLVRKTDADRVQNFTDDELGLLRELGTWIATEKVDGASCTILRDSDGRLRLCSRNWELAAPALGDTPNTMWRLAYEHVEANIEDGQWVQAEVIGEGIQKNPLKLKGQRLVVFGYGTIADGPMPRPNWPEWIDGIAVPIYPLSFPPSVDDAIGQVDQLDSLLSPGHRAEGIVWHDITNHPFDLLDGRSCFKVISNRYLLKNQD